MPQRPAALPVVAAVLQDSAGRVLLAQRPPGKDQAGLWEFPGGKIRPGERAEHALRRELQEELGIAVGPLHPFCTVRWRQAPRPIKLHAFRIDASTLDRPAQPLEHSALAWVHPRELLRYPVPLPDRPIIARLALPAAYMITPEPRGALDQYLEQLRTALQRHRPELISFRARQLNPQDWKQTAAAVLQCIRHTRPEALAVVHGSPQAAMNMGYDGVHLSSPDLLQLNQRPIPGERWLLASCHNAEELAHAEAIGADAAVLGPILATASHPDAKPIGWPRFARLQRSVSIPIYALGGLNPSHLPTAKQHGAIGIAAIGAYQR